MIASPPVQAPSHPLDALPLFRRVPCSQLRNLVYTGILNTMIALFLVLAGRMFTRDGGSLMSDLYPSLVVSHVVGYLIHLTLNVSNWALRGWPSRAQGAAKVMYFLVLIGVCVLFGITLGTALLKGTNPMVYLARSSSVTALLPFAMFMAVLIIAMIMSADRRAADETLAARQAEQIASAGQLLAEARLRALQAQIEPHFLYNTLANVVGLIETQPKQARHMLERFIDYLRASLAASRADSATLGAELDMIGAYLDVLAVRMGPRLRYRFDVADQCRSLPIAPMLLQPVIENAVAHGLEPKVEGGEIVVRAFPQGEQLCIEISDTGAGLSGAPPKAGGGVGLSNLRARLRSVYGAGAGVQLLENQPCGITVRLLLPLKVTPTSTIHAP